MCGGQLPLILYLSLEEDKRDCGSFVCIMIIIDWMWLGKYYWGRNVYVTLEREENMQV